MFGIHSHGSKDTVLFRLSNGSTSNLTTSMMNALPANALKGVDVVVYGTCSAGKGGSGASNIVNATYNKGAYVVIGFKDVTYVKQMNQWLYDFFKSMAAPNAASDAIDDAVYWTKFWNWGDAGGTDNILFRGQL